MKFFLDILENYNVFSIKTNDFSTEEGLEKSIITRQTEQINKLLKNNSSWTNVDIPFTQTHPHLIAAEKYIISSQLFDELVDLMPKSKKPLKNKNNYQTLTRYVDLNVRKPPFGWLCQEVEIMRNEIG